MRVTSLAVLLTSEVVLASTIVTSEAAISMIEVAVRTILAYYGEVATLFLAKCIH